MTNEIILTKAASGKWPCVSASIEFLDVLTKEDTRRRDGFLEELYGLFDRLQDAFDHLDREEKAKCGQWGVAVEISLQFDAANKKILLDRLFKYCDLNHHLFTSLLEILRHNFADYDLVVPTLQGYELAREIFFYLGAPEIVYIHLKAKGMEQLLMGKTSPEITFEGILEDTESHYKCKGGVSEIRQRVGPGTEIAMYRKGKEEEEEVLWMEVRIPISGNKRAN